MALLQQQFRDYRVDLIERQITDETACKSGPHPNMIATARDPANLL